MTEIIGILFIGGCIVAFILEQKKSSIQFYKKRIEDLEKEKSSLQKMTEYQNEQLRNSVVIEAINKQLIEKDMTRAKSIVALKDEEYGKQISLRDFIVDSLNTNGESVTKRKYGILVKIIELSGRDISHSYDIYREIFDDYPDQLEYTPPSKLPDILQF